MSQMPKADEMTAMTSRMDIFNLLFRDSYAIRPFIQMTEQSIAVRASKPFGMAQEVPIPSEWCTRSGFENSQEVIRLRERKFCMSERQDGGQGMRLCAGQSSNFSIAIKERKDLIEMNDLGEIAIERQPTYAIALNCDGKIVYGIRAIGETEVDDGSHFSIVGIARPEQVRCMEIVVCPKRRQRA